MRRGPAHPARMGSCRSARWSAVPVPGCDPVVLDMATGQVSRGKVLDHAARGLPLAPGDAVDADGVPTTDATAAVDGAISPFGGPKGYGIAVMVEVMAALFSGANSGLEMGDSVGVGDGGVGCGSSRPCL